MSQPVDYGTNGNISFAVSLIMSIVAWAEVDIYLSVVLKIFSIVMAFFAIKNYIANIKKLKNENNE